MHSYNIEKYKDELVSVAKTFVALFALDLGVSISQVGLEAVTNGDFWTNAFWVGILSAAARSAVSKIWREKMPISLGGKR